MKKNIIKIIVFIVIAIGIPSFIPNFKKDYFSPLDIEKSRCIAYLRWINESLFFYNDEFYDPVNKTYPKIEKIDDKFLRLLKDKNYVDINKYQGHGFRISYSAEPGKKCSYSIDKEGSIFCNYHISEQFVFDKKMETFWESFRDHLAIIVFVGIILFFV